MRTVVKAYRRPDDSLRYVRHLAFERRFRRYGHTWYVHRAPESGRQERAEEAEPTYGSLSASASSTSEPPRHSAMLWPGGVE